MSFKGARDLRKEGLYTIAQATEVLNASKATIERWIRNPMAKFPQARRNGPNGRPRYFDIKELKAFKASWFND